jgi:hypothetical protein
MNGYPYYPNIGIYIDTHGLITEEDQVLKYEEGSTFSHEGWTVMIVRNNLTASAVFNEDEVKWTDIDTSKVGEQTITAQCGDFTATIKAEVI